MYFLYSACLSFLFFILSPYFLYQAIRHGKHLDSFRQRLGRLPEAVRSDGRATIWLHAVSVGEFVAARALIDRLALTKPDWRIVVSTTTLTGQRLAKAQSSPGPENVFYFPFDWAFAARRALDWVKPSAVIIIETELWPNFLRECRRRKLTAVLVNGRISPRSFAGYKRARRFMSRVLGDLSLMVMQSTADVTRAFELGAESRRVRLCGNLKYDAQLPDYSDASIGRALGVEASRHLIVAGSTAPGEEQLLLAALRDVRERTGLEDARLLIAPRHPERFEEVAQIIARSGFSSIRRSRTNFAGRKANDVVLLDSIGELAAVYRHAAVVFVGGSLVPRGGHNVIEPAAWAKPIVVGPHTENFRKIVSDFLNANAIVQLTDPSSLALELVRLLSDKDRAAEMGERARGLLKSNSGAVDCTIRAIEEALRQ